MRNARAYVIIIIITLSHITHICMYVTYSVQYVHSM